MGLLRKEDMHESFWQEGTANPNLLINGDFKINQRGLTEYINYMKSNYTVDRWRCFTLAGDRAETTKVVVLDNGIKVIGVSGGTDGKIGTRLRQTLDSPETSKLRGKEVTFSIKLLEDCDVVFLYVNKSLNESIINKQFSNSKAGDVLSLTTVVPLDAENLSVQFMGLGDAGDSISVEWAKLELGNVATPFVSRSYGEELALCQRYFKIIENGVAIPLAFYQDLNEKRILDFYLTLSTPLRIDPTLKTDKGTEITIKDLLNNKNINNDSITLSGVTRFENTASYLNIRTSIPLDTNVKVASLYPNRGKIYLDAEIY